MLVIFFTVLTIVSCASSAPSRQKRFDVFDSYMGPYYRPYVGAFAGTGYMPQYVFPPYPFFRDPMSWIPSFIPERPWYEGENVCSEEKVMDTSDDMKEWLGLDDPSIDYSHESESCRGNNNKYICYRRITSNGIMKMKVTKYECCLGFVRNPNGPGCIEIDLRYLMPTLRNMEASKFVSIIEKAGMADDFHENNFTVFCPPDSALEAFSEDLEDDIDNEVRIKPGLQKLKKKTRLYNLLTSHLSPGFVKIDDLDDGNVLLTENPKNKIRINVYFTPEKVVTANCVPVLSGDYFARNGIIHVIEKLLPSPSKTVADVIAGDSQFSILKGMLSKAGLVQTLRNPNGSYTMFAPTDSALLSSLTSQNGGSDDRCTVSVMKHHIIDHVICSAALPHHARSLNMIGELLSLTRDQNNKLYVDGVQVVVRDLVATNGVVHIIDGILSTRQTKSVSQVLDESGLYEFLALLELANLKSEFDSMENVTFFIPADEIIQGIPSMHLESFLRHNESVADVLRFHVVEGQTELSAPDQVLHSKLENATIRFQVHTAYPQMTPKVLVQCATVLSADIKLCGGTLHVIDKLLLPPKVTIIEFLENIEGFSTLVLLLRATGLDRRLRSEQFAYTLLAPTDDAFHQLGDAALFKILEDVDRAMDLVKMHILLNSVCCSQLKNDLLSGRRQTRTMDGSLLTLEKSTDGILMVGGAHVVDCDIMATNGVIHMVDAVLAPDPASMLGGGYMDNVFILV